MKEGGEKRPKGAVHVHTLEREPDRTEKHTYKGEISVAKEAKSKGRGECVRGKASSTPDWGGFSIERKGAKKTFMEKSNLEVCRREGKLKNERTGKGKGGGSTRGKPAWEAAGKMLKESKRSKKTKKPRGVAGSCLFVSKARGWGAKGKMWQITSPIQTRAAH